MDSEPTPVWKPSKAGELAFSSYFVIILPVMLVYIYMGYKGPSDRCFVLDSGLYKLWPANIEHISQPLQDHFTNVEICQFFTCSTWISGLCIIWLTANIFFEFKREPTGIRPNSIVFFLIASLLAFFGTFFTFSDKYDILGLSYKNSIFHNIISLLFLASGEMSLVFLFAFQLLERNKMKKLCKRSLTSGK